MMLNIENVNIGDQSNVPISLDSKYLNTVGQDDIIDNITTFKELANIPPCSYLTINWTDCL